MKFAIILLVVIAVVSVFALFLGEFYPVKAGAPGWQEFWRQELNLSKPLFNLLTFFELHDPYRSWWYQFLLLLLSVSLLACIIERIPIVMRAMRTGEPRDAEAVDQMASARTFTARGSSEEIRRKLPGSFRYNETRTSGEIRVAGQHGAISHLGPILAHAGLLALVVGGVAASLLGMNTRVGGRPGDIMTDPIFDFSVRVDSFRIEYYPLGIGQYVLVDSSFLGRIIGREGDTFILEARDAQDHMHQIQATADRLLNQFDIDTDRGNIKSYISTLTVLEDGREVLTKQVEVNHPLRYKGYRFYQSSFDPESPIVDARIDSARIVIQQPDGTVVDTVYVKPGRPHPLPQGAELHLARFLPDFRMAGGQPTTASGQLRNPALLLEVRQDGRELYHQWVFLRMDFPHSPPEGGYSFKGLGVEGFQASTSYPTILEVNKNPGSWLIWLGFVLATVGLVISFYLVPQRLWVVVRDKGGGRSEVHMAGISTKNPEVFRQKFEKWVEGMKG